MSNFFTDLVEQLKDDDTKILSDGGASAEFSGSIDTGSYALNALLSGSIYGGVPNNKVTAFAGLQLVRLSLCLVLSNNFLMQILMAVLSTLILKPQLQSL